MYPFILSYDYFIYNAIADYIKTGNKNRFYTMRNLILSLEAFFKEENFNEEVDQQLNFCINFIRGIYHFLDGDGENLLLYQKALDLQIYRRKEGEYKFDEIFSSAIKKFINFKKPALEKYSEKFLSP